LTTTATHKLRRLRAPLPRDRAHARETSFLANKKSLARGRGRESVECRSRIGAAAYASLLACFACALLLCQPTGASAGAGPGARTLRVMSYNVHVGIGMDKQLDLRRIADVINRERPDLVGLQEVDVGVRRTNRADQVAELARLTGLEYAFAPNLEYQGGWYGVAVLSRFPVLKIEHKLFDHLREAERRGCLRVEVEAGGRRLSFATTHLDYQHRDNRRFETEQLLAALSGARGPLVVAGDFNDEPTGDSYKLMLTRFADAWAAATPPDDGLTYPADKPVKRIDYVFHSARLRARGARVVASLASDHRAVMAEFEFKD
jgi:endonuclease/exonuclease/phosphatase family metal-dependent hydrolase